MAKKSQTVTKKDMEKLKGYLKQKAVDKPELLFDMTKILFEEQLEFATSKLRKTVACCSRRCLEEGTLVKTVNRGLVAVEALTVDDFVWGYNKDGSISPTKIAKIWDNGTQEVVELKSGNRIILSATTNHSLLTFNTHTNRLAEKPIKSFNSRDHLVVGRVPLQIDVDMAGAYYAIGALVGDGKLYHEKHIGYSKVSSLSYSEKAGLLAGLLDTNGSVHKGDEGWEMSFHNQSLPAVNTFKMLLLELFNVDCTIQADQRGRNKNSPVYYIYFKKPAALKLVLETLSPLLQTVSKKISDEIMEVREQLKLGTVECRVGSARTAKTYDITVSNQTNLYLLGNGVVSHNSGKSTTLCACLIDSAIRYPGRLNLYITLSKTSARNIIWSDLVKMVMEHDIDVKFNHHEMVATFWNGSKVLIGGAKDTQEIEKYRGIKAQLVVLDEAQSFKPFIKELIQDILEPALGDYQGKMMVTGTPNPTCKGFFHDASNLKKGFEKWGSFHWTLKENVKFPAFVDGTVTYEELIQNILEDRGVTRDDSAFRREYLGEWAQDNDALVYNCPEEGRVCDKEDGHDWDYILAYDTGFRDDDAFAVVGYSKTCKTAYLVESLSIEKKFDEDGKVIDRGFSEAMDVIRDLNDVYRFKEIIFDPTEAGLKTATEIRRRYGINMKSAEKGNKQATIAFLNDDLRTGRLKVIEPCCKDLLQQWDNLTWDYRADGSRAIGTKIGSVKMDHAADAALYAWRASRHYMSKDPISEPEEGSSGWGAYMQRKMFKEAVEEARQEQIRESKSKKKFRKVSTF